MRDRLLRRRWAQFERCFNQTFLDQLLRWHFRQAVLAGMRGAGEPVLKCDFPPGLEMIGEILSGPRAGEWMG